MDHKDVIIQDLKAENKKLTEELEQLKQQKAAVDTGMERLTIQYDNCFVPKRLCTIDRNGDADDCDTCADACNMTSGECDKCPIQKCFDKLAQYEDMEEQGLLLKLPCKIGDTVKLKGCCEILCSFKDCPFEDSCEFDECNNGNEREFTTTVESIYNEGTEWYVTLKYIAFPIPIIDFGRTIFLTEQEAQAALEKMKGE